LAVYAVVPAYNEAPSVAAVVEALRASGAFEDVVVVDDGSTDDTAARAEAAGAVAIRTPKNLGKGGAMLYGTEAIGETSTDDRVAFFDADLVGLEPRHVRRMVDASDLGYDQVAGLQDRGDVVNLMQLYGPLVTGQRVLRRWILDTLPQTCWTGYCVETAINDVVEREKGTTLLVMLDGIDTRTKLDKVGMLDGIAGQWRMIKQIAKTRDALRRTGGMSCSI
jgi:glycosyltransferase involved in cell wall biosynthesis